MSRRSLSHFVAVAAMWGASYLFIKVAVEDVFSPPMVAFLRTLLATLAVAPLAVRAGGFGELRGRAGAVVVMAALQVAVPVTFIAYGEQHIPSSLAGILVASAPIYSFVLAAIFSRDQRSGALAYGGVVAGLIGVALLLGVDLSGADALAGGLMVALAGPCYALAGLHLKRSGLDRVQPIVMVTATMGVSALLCAPLAATDLPDGAPSLAAVGSLLALGVLGTGLAFVYYFELIADVGPSRAILVTYVAPVFAVGYGAVLLGEAVTLSAAGGLVLILAGSWVAANDRLPWQRAARTRRRCPDPV